MNAKDKKVLFDIYDILEENREGLSNYVEDEISWLRDNENTTKEETQQRIEFLKNKMLKAENGIGLIKKLFNKN